MPNSMQTTNFITQLILEMELAYSLLGITLGVPRHDEPQPVKMTQ